ncbi:hypothetical protein ACIBO2_35140 [Nonomuraea sp. NPDC050022]|uniref:hypothetical protein n=1 Tax=Nonomuraea sp. NPDC050022 TaxID=3364358 RepID=UPI00379EE473
MPNLDGQAGRWMRRPVTSTGVLALSDQERDTLDLIGEGLTNRQIGENDGPSSKVRRRI